MTEPVRLNAAEARAVWTAILKATALAAGVQRRLAIGEAIGWPADVRADLAEGRRQLNAARVGIVAAKARRVFEARHR